MSEHLRRQWRIAATSSAIPPEPGTAPIPSGSVRLFHVTAQENLDSIKRQGLTVSNAQGSNYGEPNLVWGSTRTDYWRDPQGKIMVEFWVPWDKIVDNFSVPGSPLSASYPGGPASWNSGNHNVAMPFDVSSSQIVAIHENWHNTYRYLDSPQARQRIMDGFYDNLLDGGYPDEAQAIAQIKAEEA